MRRCWPWAHCWHYVSPRPVCTAGARSEFGTYYLPRYEHWQVCCRCKQERRT